MPIRTSAARDWTRDRAGGASEVRGAEFVPSVRLGWVGRAAALGNRFLADGAPRRQTFLS